MNIPDCVSPIVGYRAWGWNASGLTSLSGESWRPNRALEAQCAKSPNLRQAPQAGCTCGVYASKNLDEFSRRALPGIHGEVYLWGTVVEHELEIRHQISSAIHAVVQVSRLSDGTRKVMGISEVTGMDEDVISTQDIFVFDRRGADESGRERGVFRATGIRPKFTDLLATAGCQLRSSLFDSQLDV